MKLTMRILLLLVMCRLAFESMMHYAFAFEEGYPLAPLLALAGCFWVYVQLRPTPTRPRQVIYNGESFDSILFLILAFLCSAYLLEIRHEAAFTPLWYVHLATLTFFQLLVPFIVSYAFGRAQTAVSTLTTLLLLFILWKGTELSRVPKVSMEFNSNEMREQSMRSPDSTSIQQRPEAASWKIEPKPPNRTRSI